MNEVTQAKAELRAEFRKKLADVPVSERDRAAAVIFDVVRSRSEWQEAKTVMLYVPLPGELNILPLLNAAIHHHKTLTLPRFNRETQTYEAAVVKNLASDLVRGEFGVSEPDPECPVCPVNQLDVTMVPGLAFDGEGRRLGRGKGFYDRLLADATGWLWGVGHDVQLAGQLPVESHDVVLNCIVTPSRWVDVRPMHG